MKALLARLNIDTYILLLAGTVLLASTMPARGAWAKVAGMSADAGIVLLFFMHGARLSTQAVIDGARHWRLHSAVAFVTYVIFPLLGIALNALPFLNPALGTGLLFLTLLPSTVQSSIAFTAMAKGNVPAAVCSASFSNLAGLFITPILVAALITGKQGGISADAVVTIAFQLLLPFIAGHLLRPWIGNWVARQKQMLAIVDRGSILLVIYAAFGSATVSGLWSEVSPLDLGMIAACSTILLVIVLLLTHVLGRRLGFNREDRIVLQFCGSKKSLASGVPMAGVLFSASQVGAIILPLMFFHQIQLMICAVLARRYAASE
ncbi:MAG: bile acid:sodium symporter family protein [Novosphingobium sp.]